VKEAISFRFVTQKTEPEVEKLSKLSCKGSLSFLENDLTFLGLQYFQVCSELIPLLLGAMLFLLLNGTALSRREREERYWFSEKFNRRGQSGRETLPSFSSDQQVLLKLTWSHLCSAGAKLF